MGCRTNGMLLLWIFAFWSTFLVGLLQAYETDADNNAALEGMKDSSSGLSIGIPYSFTCKSYKTLRHAKILCGGKMCFIKCNPGYSADRKNAFVYVCNLATGEWGTIPKGKQLPWSDCFRQRRRVEPKIFNGIKPLKQIFRRHERTKSPLIFNPRKEEMKKIKMAVKATEFQAPEKGDFELGNESKIPYPWEEEEENMTLG